MTDLKQHLLSTGLFVDNEYFEQYVNLVKANENTKQTKFATQQHHVFPVSYSNFMGVAVDNSKSNLVTLLFKDHVIAHALLAMCASNDKLKHNNLCALRHILGCKYTNISDAIRWDIEHLEIVQLAYEANREAVYKFNPMFDADKKQFHDNVMRSSDVRTRISDTLKQKACDGTLFTDEHRAKISEATRGRIYLHKNSETTSVRPEDVDKYLREGWERGPITPVRSKDSYWKPEGFNQDPSFRATQSARLKQFYADNPDWKTRSKHPVVLWKDNVVYNFLSVKEAERFIGVRDSALGAGILSESFKTGVVMLKDSLYYQWSIKKD